MACDYLKKIRLAMTISTPGSSSPDKGFGRESSTRWRVDVDTAGCNRGSQKMKGLLVACNKAIPPPKLDIDYCTIKYRSLSNADSDAVS